MPVPCTPPLFTQHFFDDKKVPYYHRMRHEGILRNLVVRQSAKTGELLINLVAATQWENYGFTAEEILGEYVEGLLALAKTEEFAGSIAGILYTENKIVFLISYILILISYRFNTLTATLILFFLQFIFKYYSSKNTYVS